MAATILIQDDGEFFPRGAHLPRALLVACLLVALPGARKLASQWRLGVALSRPRPAPEVVLQGLAQPNPEQIQAALAALERLPPQVAAGVLRRAPLGLGGLLDQLAAPILRRRGDPAALAALAQLRPG